MSEAHYVIQVWIGGAWRTQARVSYRHEAERIAYKVFESGRFEDVRLLEGEQKPEGGWAWHGVPLPVPLEVADPLPEPRKRRRKRPPMPVEDAPELPLEDKKPKEEAKAPSWDEPPPPSFDEPPPSPMAPTPPSPPVAETHATAYESELFNLVGKTEAGPAFPELPALDPAPAPRSIADVRARLRSPKPLRDTPSPMPAMAGAGAAVEALPLMLTELAPLPPLPADYYPPEPSFAGTQTPLTASLANDILLPEPPGDLAAGLPQSLPANTDDYGLGADLPPPLPPVDGMSSPAEDTRDVTDYAKSIGRLMDTLEPREEREGAATQEDRDGDIKLPAFMAEEREVQSFDTFVATLDERAKEREDALERRGRKDKDDELFKRPSMESRRGLESESSNSFWIVFFTTVVLLVGAAGGLGWYFRDELPFEALMGRPEATPAPAPTPALPPGMRRASPDLMVALDVGDAEGVAKVLSTGASPNVVDDKGVPVILRAARQGDDGVIKALLDKGADPGFRGALRFGAFEQAVIEGLAPAVGLMASRGAKVDGPDSIDPCVTPLMRALEQGHLDVVRVLIQAGASPLPRPGCATGPLDIARDKPEFEAALAIARRVGEGPKPPEPEAPERIFIRSLIQPVESGNERTLRALLVGGLPEGVSLNALRINASDKWGSGERSLVDHAAYQ
ncbi:MAG: ankyrin repeat domain-containing protein, partial [Alphaproteobacteria bacterium]|nr:ankyrin repeat domain-containing protein [Alphaproteobacteria bacterium]